MNSLFSQKVTMSLGEFLILLFLVLLIITLLRALIGSADNSEQVIISQLTYWI